MCIFFFKLISDREVTTLFTPPPFPFIILTLSGALQTKYKHQSRGVYFLKKIIGLLKGGNTHYFSPYWQFPILTNWRVDNYTAISPPLLLKHRLDCSSLNANVGRGSLRKAVL